MTRTTANLLCGFLLASMGILSALAWNALPSDAALPIHWGWSLQADSFADKGVALWILPFAAAVGWGLISVLPRLEPRRENLAKSLRAYHATGAATVGLLAWLHTAIVLPPLGVAVSMRSMLSVGMGLMFVVLGNFLGKVRSNFMFGLRTPWTLSSDLSWNKSHRLLGRTWVVLGVAIVAAGFIGGPGALFWTLLGGGGGTTLAASVYSWWVWRSDPARADG